MEILPQNPKKHKVQGYPEGRNYRPRPVPPTPAPSLPGEPDVSGPDASADASFVRPTWISDG